MKGLCPTSNSADRTLLSSYVEDRRILVRGGEEEEESTTCTTKTVLTYIKINPFQVPVCDGRHRCPVAAPPPHVPHGAARVATRAEGGATETERGARRSQVKSLQYSVYHW